MSDDLVSRATIKAQMLRMGEPVAFGSDADMIDELAQALTEARAEIEALKSQLDEALIERRIILDEGRKWQLRAITAESELSTLRARVREVVGLGLDVISEERGWGTYSRMEGSEIYTDADVFSRAARQLNEDLK